MSLGPTRHETDFLHLHARRKLAQAQGQVAADLGMDGGPLLPPGGADVTPPLLNLTLGQGVPQVNHATGRIRPQPQPGSSADNAAEIQHQVSRAFRIRGAHQGPRLTLAHQTVRMNPLAAFHGGRVAPELNGTRGLHFPVSGQAKRSHLGLDRDRQLACKRRGIHRDSSCPLPRFIAGLRPISAAWVLKRRVPFLVRM